MNDPFALAAHNSIVALVFAVVVFGATRVWRNPPVAHVLWVLVLVKLVVPPVVRLDLAALELPGTTRARSHAAEAQPQIAAESPDSDPRFVDGPTDRAATEHPTMIARGSEIFEGAQQFWPWARPAVLWLWLGGAALCAFVAAQRIVRFERRLRDTLRAPEPLQRLATGVAGKLGVRGALDVRCAESVDIPLLWCVCRRPTIVLPMRLISELDDQGLELILAHEIAHLRRGDHWVRLIELVVSAVCWWNPLVWLIRRQIHQVEDLCCDAWVRWSFPDRIRRYAEVLLKTAESLSASPPSARLLPASLFLRSLSLKRRIEMILESRFAPRMSARSVCVVAAMGLLVLPLFLVATKTGAQTRSEDSSGPAQWAVDKAVAFLDQAQANGQTPPPPAPGCRSELEYEVKFEQGATAFFDGDKITILEVRGTADTFIPGHIYWIRGTYKLSSRDKASLAAYTTAMDAENARGTPLKVQSTVVDKGEGTFTLFLPMTCRGWPHVSFYPAEGGADLGGSYFGTGDSVLKRWWGSNEKDRKLTDAAAGSSDSGRPAASEDSSARTAAK
jgi:beta-lactamase regulating signal transducer with metallopeptidase domain